jgi:predicted RND superfamily exporter protein
MSDGHYIERVDRIIRGRTLQVLAGFLLLTLVFSAGLGTVSTAAGTQQFAEDIPAEQALSEIQAEFTPAFEEDTGSTQLIQRSPNVLARDPMLRMLTAQKRLAEREELRVVSTTSAAQLVATTLDPSAETADQQITAIERATPAEIDAAVRTLADRGAIQGVVSDDFSRKDASASATIGVVSHEVPGGLSSAAAGQGGASPLTDIQQEASRVVGGVAPGITVFGSGLISAEFSAVITDSLLVVTPAAVLFILFFLVVAYRDLVDLLLGTAALGMAIVWTFGFLGLAGIPFNQVMIAVPPLMLAVGIDFGIHSVNRYREEREAIEADGTDSGAAPDEAMSIASRQLLVAFAIVTGTTVIGFLSNLTSNLVPIRDFGIVAAVGILFTFFVFGVFLPAAKLQIDRLRESYPIPTFSTRPLGSEGSVLGSVLMVGIGIGRRAPAVFLLAMLLSSAILGGYATGIDTSFSERDFLPPEETPDYLQQLPEPFRPSEYSVVSQLNFLEDNFAATQGGSTTVYWETRMEQDAALEEIHRANRDPPESFVSEDRRAATSSVLSVLERLKARDPAFAALVARNDRNGNGVPDRNLEEIYDYMLSSPLRAETLRYLSEDRRSTRVVYSLEASAENAEVTADTRAVAERFRGDATATGGTVVFSAVSDLILRSAILSLAVALAGTVVFLVIAYWLVEGRPLLGIVNTVPIVVAVSAVAGSMRAAGIPFNAFTATILALTIGLGIDYSVHVVHRFLDERAAHGRWLALERTLRGTGGALAGSMLTTVSGIGVLVLAVLSVLGQFGILTALSVFYSFVASVVVLPSALVLWDRLVAEDADTPLAPTARGG